MRAACLLAAALAAVPASAGAAGTPEARWTAGQEAFLGAAAAPLPKPFTPSRAQARGAALPVCAAPPSPAAFTALTYNAGLGPGLDVPYALERVGPAAAAVAAAPWDVLCLDEVWTDAARDAVLAALGLPAAQTVTADTRGQNEDPADRCASGDLDAGLACMRAKCAGVPVEDAQNCAARLCRREGLDLYLNAPGCFNCVVASAGKSADEIKAACEGAGASRVFGGRNGVLLASRRPLRNVEALPLPSSFSNRVALFATVEAGGERVEVACTHLSAALGLLPPNDKRFKDWDEEMVAQLDLTAARLAARAGGGAQLLLGDLNTGPKSTGDLAPDAPAVWSRIAALGFTSPAAQAAPALCSRCQGNLISPTNDRYLIDHVLARGRGALSPACAGQAFDAPVSVVDPGGRSVATSLSDHYGITVRFSAP